MGREIGGAPQIINQELNTILIPNTNEDKQKDINSSLFKNALKWVAVGALVLGFLYGFLWLTRK